MLCPLCLEQCLANSRCSLNTSCMLKMQDVTRSSLSTAPTQTQARELSVNEWPVLRMLALAMPRFSVLGQGVDVDLIWVSYKPPLRAFTHSKEVSPGTEWSQPSGGHLGNFRCCQMSLLGRWWPRLAWEGTLDLVTDSPGFRPQLCHLLVIWGKTFCFYGLHL